MFLRSERPFLIYDPPALPLQLLLVPVASSDLGLPKHDGASAPLHLALGRSSPLLLGREVRPPAGRCQHLPFGNLSLLDPLKPLVERDDDLADPGIHARDLHILMHMLRSTQRRGGVTSVAGAKQTAVETDRCRFQFLHANLEMLRNAVEIFFDQPPTDFALIQLFPFSCFLAQPFRQLDFNEFLPDAHKGWVVVRFETDAEAYACAWRTPNLTCAGLRPCLGPSLP